MSSRTANERNLKRTENEMEKYMKTNSFIVVDESSAETGIEFLENTKKIILHVPKSGYISNSIRPDVLSRIFTYLLPYGGGQLGSPKNEVSLEKMYPILSEDIYQNSFRTSIFRICCVWYHIKRKGLE